MSLLIFPDFFNINFLRPGVEIEKKQNVMSEGCYYSTHYILYHISVQIATGVINFLTFLDKKIVFKYDAKSCHITVYYDVL